MNNVMKKSQSAVKSLLGVAAAAAGAFIVSTAQAAVPGITGPSPSPSFAITASAGYSSQPDGAQIYSWGYGCTAAAANCPHTQFPGPTMIVHQGDVVTVALTNALPPAAGNTSIVFPGFSVSSPNGVAGRLAQEAANGSTVTYTFTATKPGTYSYYSGTQPELQIEMGMFGAVVVLPATSAGCTKGPYSLAASAYGDTGAGVNPTCYDREYLFQFSEISSNIHDQVKAQVDACPAPTAAAPCAAITAPFEPYRPNYYLINGRSMPDLMDVPFSAAYPHQPYNGNPHMHPGELVLMRIIGQGRWQHPFHFHGNHARVLARDGNLLLSQSDSTKLAGPLLFTTPTVSGQSQDQIFTWTGQGLNWDVYGSDTATQAHTCNGRALTTPGDTAVQSVGFDPVTHEYCLDHGKPIPVTPPDPQIVANGQWYGGTPYLGLSGFNPVNLPPGTLNQNPGAGYAYMWHSHNEREITTNDVFPGGMLMMLIIDPPNFPIDETL